MADFATNYTARIKITYQTLNLQHSWLFRVPRGTTPAQLQPWYDKITNWLNQLVGVRYTDFTILGAQFSAEDSSFFVPVASPTAPAAGTVALPATIRYAEQANMISFAGRSAGGHRQALYFFSIAGIGTATQQVDARITSLESAVVSNAVNALNAGPLFVANDNQNCAYYPYVNLKQSTYITRRARG